MIRESTSIFKMIKSLICVLLLAASSVHCNVTSTCGQREICNSFLDVAIDMIAKAKQNVPICNNCPKIESKPFDCADLLKMGHSTSGIYEIWPMNRITEGKSVKVFCDMNTDGGGWTVFQRRGNYQTPKDYFYRDWESYKEGFGNLDNDFWLGNDNIFALTNQKDYSVRFDMKDVSKNSRFALYDTFWIDDEDHSYTLHISKYSGDAEGESEAEDNVADMSGDGEDEGYQYDDGLESDESQLFRYSGQKHHSIGDSMEIHNNRPFATFDRDNANRCANAYKGAWWYSNCQDVKLNFLFHRGRHSTHDGTTWITFSGLRASLLWTEIKIRPKHFTPVTS